MPVVGKLLEQFIVNVTFDWLTVFRKRSIFSSITFSSKILTSFLTLLPTTLACLCRFQKFSSTERVDRKFFSTVYINKLSWFFSFSLPVNYFHEEKFSFLDDNRSCRTFVYLPTLCSISGATLELQRKQVLFSITKVVDWKFAPKKTIATCKIGQEETLKVTFNALMISAATLDKSMVFGFPIYLDKIHFNPLFFRALCLNPIKYVGFYFFACWVWKKLVFFTPLHWDQTFTILFCFQKIS